VKFLWLEIRIDPRYPQRRFFKRRYSNNLSIPHAYTFFRQPSHAIQHPKPVGMSLKFPPLGQVIYTEVPIARSLPP
jgi:hypothetical protein